MKKIFSLSLIAVGLLISGNAKAVDVASVSINDGDPTNYDSFGEAFKAAAGAAYDSKITLLQTVTYSGNDELWLSSGKHVTIDMNGKNISSNNGFRLFRGTLELTGKGTFFGTKEVGRGGFAWVYGSNQPNPDPTAYSVLIVGKDVTVTYADNIDWWNPINISYFTTSHTPNKPDDIDYNTKKGTGGVAYGVQVHIYGTIYSRWFGITVNGGIAETTGKFPEIYVYGSAVIEDHRTDNTAKDAGCGIYAAGYAKWDIKGFVSGETGIYAKAGQITLEDAIIEATGPFIEPVANNNGMSGSGCGVVLDSHNGYAGGTILVSNGDTKITATDGSAICEAITQGTEQTQSIILNSGTFEGGNGHGALQTTEYVKDGDIIKIGGGTYNSNVTDYVDQSKGGIIVESVDENGNKVFVISNTGSENPVSWTSDLLNATAESYVKLNSAVATEVNVNKDITCAFLAVEGLDKVIVKKGYTLTVGEVVLGGTGGTGVIEVESGAKLLVTGDKGLYSPAPENFILKADAEGMATFVFNPDVKSNKTPYATMQYVSGAQIDDFGNRVWEIITTPFAVLTSFTSDWSNASVTQGYSQGTTLKYHDAVNGWTNYDNLEELYAGATAFSALAISNPSVAGGVVYTFKGKLQGNLTGSLELKEGWNYIGNGWAANLKSAAFISAITASNKVDGTMYIWNAGRQGYDFGSHIPAQLPATSFIAVYAKEDTILNLDYSELIWNNN